MRDLTLSKGKKRRKRPYHLPHRELDVEALTRGFERTETAWDGVWKVRRVVSEHKHYTCPGCHHEIPPNTTHVVAYRQDHIFGAEAGLAERRHWHTGCWRGR